MSTLKLSLVGFGSRVFLVGVNVASVILLARFLAPQGRGEYFLFQSLTSVLCVFGDCGISQSVNVFVGKETARKSAIHSFVAKSTIVLWLGLSVFGGVSLWLAGDVLLPGFPLKWQLAAFAILPFMLYAAFWNGMMVGLGEIVLLNIVQLVLGPLQLLLVLVFVVAFSGGVGTAIGIYFVVMFAQFAMMVAGAFRVGLFHRSAGVEEDLTRELMRFGLRGYPNALATMAWMRMPIFFLNSYHGQVPVGIYSVAQQLSEKALLPVQAVQDAIFKKVTGASAREVVQLMNRYVRIMFIGVAIGACSLAAVSPWMVAVLFGGQYQSAVPVFRILLAGVATISVAMIVSTYVLGQRGRPGLLSLLAASNAIVCFLLSVWLIPSWGAVGAASALALTQVLGTAVVVSVYLSLARTSPQELFVPSSGDIVMLGKQLTEFLRRKGQPS